MQGKHYIMRKLNREKEAGSEERRKELEAEGYVCIGVREPAGPGGSLKGGQEEGRPVQQASAVKDSRKKQKTNAMEGAGDKDGNGTDDAGKG